MSEINDGGPAFPIPVLARMRGRAQEAEPRVLHSCGMGVECEEAGVCYASAHGRPEECGRPDVGGRQEVSTTNLRQIACGSSHIAKSNALVNAANEIDRLRAANAKVLSAGVPA